VSPDKPRKRTGAINFGADGSVEKEVLEWPVTQKEQEMAAVQALGDGLALTGRSLTDIEPILDEQGHDVRGRLDGEEVEFQVAELVTRPYVSEIGAEPGDALLITDPEGLEKALATTLQHKLPPKKNYAASHTKAILLVYAIDGPPIAGLEDQADGSKRETAGLTLARELAAKVSGVFAEIWFVQIAAGFALAPWKLFPVDAAS
jgi:hypothetical protein